MKRNFTLTELLVVIAIIGILAGMTMPALSFARAAGQRTKCINNKANIIKAMQTYANNNDEMIPFKLEGKSYAYALVGEAYTQVKNSSRPSGWKYTKSYLQPGLLTCTVGNADYNDANGDTNNAFGMLDVIGDEWTKTNADSTKTVKNWKGINNQSIYKQFGRFLVAGAGSNPDDVAYSIGRMKNTSILPLFADSFLTVADNDPTPKPRWRFFLLSDPGDNPYVAMMHSGQTTIAYADGSARAVSAKVAADESGLNYTLNAELDTPAHAF